MNIYEKLFLSLWAWYDVFRYGYGSGLRMIDMGPVGA